MSRSPAASLAHVARLSQAAPIFAALGDETRLRVVARLCAGGPLSTSRLTEGLGVSRQAVAKHLQALEDAGLVSSSRAGRERIWEIEAKRLTTARRYIDQISTRWDEAIVRLRNLVETGDDDEP